MENSKERKNLHNLLAALQADGIAERDEWGDVDEESVASYVEGRCSPAVKRRVEAAMLRCEEVRQLVECLRRDPYFLGGYAHPTTNGYAHPAMEHIALDPTRLAQAKVGQPAIRTPPSTRTNRWARQVAAAAAILLCSILSWSWWVGISAAMPPDGGRPHPTTPIVIRGRNFPFKNETALVNPDQQNYNYDVSATGDKTPYDRALNQMREALNRCERSKFSDSKQIAAYQEAAERAERSFPNRAMTPNLWAQFYIAWGEMAKGREAARVEQQAREGRRVDAPEMKVREAARAEQLHLFKMAERFCGVAYDRGMVNHPALYNNRAWARYRLAQLATGRERVKWIRLAKRDASEAILLVKSNPQEERECKGFIEYVDTYAEVVQYDHSVLGGAPPSVASEEPELQPWAVEALLAKVLAGASDAPPRSWIVDRRAGVDHRAGLEELRDRLAGLAPDHAPISPPRPAAEPGPQPNRPGVVLMARSEHP